MKQDNWKHHPRHKVTRKVVNLDEGQIVLPIESVHVYSWHREEDAKGFPEQVHVVCKLMPTPAFKNIPDMVMRLKSREACDAIITALENHRDDVFPIDED